jgi:hypothetical protein
MHNYATETEPLVGYIRNSFVYCEYWKVQLCLGGELSYSMYITDLIIKNYNLA